jgi:hypothetical protein
MIDTSRWFRASGLAVALALTTAPVAFAGDPQGPSQNTTTPAAPAQPADTSKSALPKAGSNNPPSTKPGASDNPFHPHSAAMLRQSNRLKASGYGNYVWNDGQIVLALNSTMTILNRTDRDYQGHRGQAIHEIDAAIHQIKSKAGKSGAAIVTPVRGAAKGAKPVVSPDESEAQLREAQKSLMTIESHMVNGGNAKRLAVARVSVQKAIQEINGALAIR